MEDIFWRIQCGNWSRLLVAPVHSSPVELATKAFEVISQEPDSAKLAVLGFRIDGDQAEIGKAFHVFRDYSIDLSWQYPSDLILANAGHFYQV
jgi:hypothetical protein